MLNCTNLFDRRLSAFLTLRRRKDEEIIVDIEIDLDCLVLDYCTATLLVT